MIEEARKLSKLFYSLERLVSFMKRDYSIRLQETGNYPHYETYTKQKVSEVEGELSKLRALTFRLGGGDFNNQKLTLYIHYLLITYLTNQSKNLLQDCITEQDMLRGALDIDVQRYNIERNGVMPASQIERLAINAVKQAGEEYAFLNEVVSKFLRLTKISFERIQQEFKASNSFILGNAYDEAMSADAPIERIGELLHLPQSRFEKVLNYAENAAIDEDKPKNYSKPILTVQQVVILFDALRHTGGISPDVSNKSLGNHLGYITGLSSKKLGQNFSNVRTYINENKNGRDADDAQTVKTYLQEVIKAIDSAIE